MALSPPQWATARQSRLSVGRLSTAPGSSTSGPPGVVQLGEGVGRAAGWGGGTGLGEGLGIFPSKNTLPWLLGCGDQKSSLQSSASRLVGEAGSPGFLGAAGAMSDPRKLGAGQAQHLAMEKCWQAEAHTEQLHKGHMNYPMILPASLELGRPHWSCSDHV